MAKGIGALRGDVAFRTRTVDLSDWDAGKVTIREITATEHLKLITDYQTEDIPAEKAVEFYCDLVLLGVVDENNERAFKADDKAGLKDKPLSLLEKIAMEVMSLSGMGKEGRVDAEKN